MSGATDPPRCGEVVLRDGDGPVERTFDVVRVGGATEALSMILGNDPTWSGHSSSADGEELALVFDPQELAHAMQDPDVQRRACARRRPSSQSPSRQWPVVRAWPSGRGRCEAGPGVPAGGTQAIVNDAGAVGASGTGYVIPAGSDEAIVNDAGATGASGTGYVIPAGSDEAIVTQAPAVGASGSPVTLSRPAATKRSLNQAPAVGASGTGYVVPAGTDEAIVNETVARPVQAVPATSSRRVAHKGFSSTMLQAPLRLLEATRRCRRQRPQQSGPCDTARRRRRLRRDANEAAPGYG